MKKYSIIFCSLILFFSCKKQDATTATEKQAAKRIVNRQPVDQKLLKKYIDYKLASERAALLSRENRGNIMDLPKMSSIEFEKMINNYLANESNSMFCPPWENCTTTEIDGDGGYDSNDPPFAANGTLHGSTINNILFTGDINNGVISGYGWSFSGTHGTITEVGGLQQSIHNGVTTYMQYFNEQIIIGNGVNYNQQFVVYGNVYGESATLNAMYNPQP